MRWCDVFKLLFLLRNLYLIHQTPVYFSTLKHFQSSHVNWQRNRGPEVLANNVHVQKERCIYWPISTMPRKTWIWSFHVNVLLLAKNIHRRNVYQGLMFSNSSPSCSSKFPSWNSRPAVAVLFSLRAFFKIGKHGRIFAGKGCGGPTPSCGLKESTCDGQNLFFANDPTNSKLRSSEGSIHREWLQWRRGDQSPSCDQKSIHWNKICSLWMVP